MNGMNGMNELTGYKCTMVAMGRARTMLRRLKSAFQSLRTDGGTVLMVVGWRLYEVPGDQAAPFFCRYASPAPLAPPSQNDYRVCVRHHGTPWLLASSGGTHPIRLDHRDDFKRPSHG